MSGGKEEQGAPTLRVWDFPAWSADRRYTPTESGGGYELRIIPQLRERQILS